MVHALATDSAGNIWVGTRKGLSVFNGRKFQHYLLDKEQQRPLNVTQQLFVIRDTVWWRAGGELYYVAGGKIKYMVTPRKELPVTALLAEPGQLWVAKEDSIFHCANNRWDSTGFPLTPGSTKGPSISRMYRDRNGIMWLATNGGLYFLDGNSITPYTVGGQPLNYFSVMSVTQDKGGALWLGTNTGVVKVFGNSVQLYNKRNGLSDNTVYDIITDAEHNIWIATDGQGIFRFSGTLFTGLDETMGLPSGQVMAIAAGKHDSLFLGTYDAGLFIFKDGKISARPFPTTPAPSISSLCYASGHKLWIGTRGRGLYEYDHQVFRQFTATEHGFPSNTILRLYEDPDNRLWVGFTNGVLLYAHDTFRTIPVGRSQIVAFLSVGRDSILIATDNVG
ncbi:MAG: hypothetical protein EBZ77_16775, partial [Chitinophagia bacterium]|nr:hypothetical protein [Chitinophagia bacterium]